MALSDDEAKAVPHIVSNYHFVDDNDEPISFHVLPIEWSKGERQDGKKEKIFLHGTADNGLQRIYKHVIAWKFDLSLGNHPEIYVLSKENTWLKLQKPRKSFEGTIRSILVTVQCLHYVKRNPEASYKSVWVYLFKVFGLHEVRCSKNDLMDHFPLICDSVKRDDALGRSKFLVNFLEEKPTKGKLSDEHIQATEKLRFLVDDVEDDMIDDAENESNEIDSLFTSVCALCDDGGDLLCCEGECLRSFHPTVEAAVGSDCKSLGFTKDEVDATPNFFCKNCKYKQHQCFACGKLGSSDKSSGAEVVRCVSAICGQFYHPCCVAKLIYQDTGVSVEELEKKISMGESFTCPIHKCCVCKQEENREDQELQFAVCMRCPKSYHRKCLPREIAFEKGGGMHVEGRVIPRAWEGLLPNRILIYCTKHKMDVEGRTTIRNHLKFPNVEESKRKPTWESLFEREKVVSKKRMLSVEEVYRVKTAPAISKEKQKPSAVKVGRNRDKVFSGSDYLRMVIKNTASRKEHKTSISKENKTSLGGHTKTNGDGEHQKSLSHGKNRGNETSGKLQRGGKEKYRKGIVEISSVNKQDGGKISANEMLREMPQHAERGDSNQHSGTTNGAIQVNLPDDKARRCIIVSNEPCSSVTRRWSDGTTPGSGNRANEMDERFTWESDVGTQVCIYRQQDPDVARCNSLVGQDSVYSQIGSRSSTFYGCLGSAADSSSAGKPLGFAPGPHLTYSLHNSAGWLDE